MPATMPATMPADPLRQFRGVGKSLAQDLHSLGIHLPSDLAAADPDHLYRALAQQTGLRQDPCVLDVFRCAVAQARDPNLPEEQKDWWYWSRLRKSGQLPSG
jgi:hypothetical protein